MLEQEKAFPKVGKVTKVLTLTFAETKALNPNSEHNPSPLSLLH